MGSLPASVENLPLKHAAPRKAAAMSTFLFMHHQSVKLQFWSDGLCLSGNVQITEPRTHTRQHMYTGEFPQSVPTWKPLRSIQFSAPDDGATL